MILLSTLCITPQIALARPITLTTHNPINLGLIISDSHEESSLSLSPNSIYSIQGNLIISNDPIAGHYTIHGDPHRTVHVSLMPDTISESNIRLHFSTNLNNSLCTLDTHGECSLEIGCHLEIHGHPKLGDYNTSTAITVVYVSFP